MNLKSIYEVVVFPHRENPDLLEEIWYQQGERHREHGPAHIIRNADGKEITQCWFRKGALHRIGGPAHIHSDDAIYIENWYQNGGLHREDGPATREVVNGVVTHESWITLENGLHRIGAPAMTSRHPETGVLKYEGWFEKDKLHRLDGPACIRRDTYTGEITSVEYRKRGRRYTPAKANEAPGP